MWIEVHQTLPNSRKIMRLRRELKIKKPAAIGHMVLLWLWALGNAIDGDLADFTDEDIAEVCEWNGKDATAFVNALVEAGFLDRSPDGSLLFIHNWEQYAGRVIEWKEFQEQRPSRSAEEKREQTRLRVRAYRERQKEAADVTQCVTHDVTQCNALQVTHDVTQVTHCNADTIPYHTIPNHTIPNHTDIDDLYINNNINNNHDREVVGGKEKRRSFVPPTVEEVTAYCRERGNNVSPERFINFYASKGWMVGKNKMKDWKAAVRSWEGREDDVHIAKPAGQDTGGDKAGASKWNLQTVDLG